MNYYEETKRKENSMQKLLLGKVIITKRALEKFGQESILNCLKLHQRRKWGDTCPQSVVSWNQKNIKNKVMSVHELTSESCYIYTDFIKQQTEVFVREDY